MIISTVPVSNCTPQTIVIGRRGTYETMQIAFDLSSLVQSYGNGVAVLAVKRSQDESAYPAVVTQEDNTLTWTISETDTYYVGSGECQLMWYVDGGLAKTIIYPMVVMRDILATAEEPPDGYENWVEHLTGLGANTQQNAQEAAQSATEAKASEESAAASAKKAEDAAGMLVDVSATATTLEPGQPATAEYDEGVFKFGIPKGPKGDKLTYADLTEADKDDLVQGPILEAQTSAVSAVGTAKTNAVNAVNQAGETQVNAVNTAGATQVQAVEDKGAEVIDSIPQDYSDLVDDVADLTRQLNDETTGLDTKAPVIINTASGAIASFDDGADGMPIRKLVAQIEPVQDLHGYDSPWPAGGGVNKLSISGSYTKEGDGYVIPFTDIEKIPAGEYTITITSSNAIAWVARFYNENSDLVAEASSLGSSVGRQSRTFTLGADAYKFRVYVNGSTTISDIQVEAGSTATDYRPYSNLCPISGHTGLTVNRTGFNVWDEEWEIGGYEDDGSKNTRTDRIRCKNFISVKPSTTYYIKAPSAVNNLIYYTASKEVISIYGNGNFYNKTFTTPDNCYYIAFNMYSTYGTTYNNDIGINYPATDTTYHPYTGNQISVTFPSEAGTVYGGEDEVISGKLKSTMTIVDLGELSWRYAVDANRFLSDILPDAKRPESGTEKANMLCSEYPVYSVNTAMTMDKAIGMGTSGSITVRDSAFGTDAVSFKAAMSGVQLCYELAEPVEYTLSATELTTLYGQNNIWADTGDVEVTYPCDTRLYIDNKITQAIAAALNA